MIRATEQAEERRSRLEQQMVDLLPGWSLAPAVEAIQALRGVAVICAITVVAEVGDFRRFANPRQLMAWIGLVPCERSSGATTARGAITKAGNSRVRRVLVESAWSYRLPARIGRDLHERSHSLPDDVRAIAWKAQIRLCARYRRMQHAGRPANVITVAIARELAAFICAIATIVDLPETAN